MALILPKEVRGILGVVIDKHKNWLDAECWNALLAKDHCLQAP
jgi:hypothetical protein